MLSLKKQNVLKEIRSYTVITFSLFIAAIGWSGFIIPSDIVGGGIIGIASIVYYTLNIPVGPVNLLLNVILVVVAIKILGKSFGVKTIYSIVVFSALIAFFQVYFKEPIVSDKFMAAIIGGGLAGASIGILFMNGASTGGTEIIAMLVNKYRNVSPGRVMMFCDIVIIGSSYIIFRSLETVVYGYVVMGVMSYVADMILTGSRQSVQIFIVSSNPEQVADAISQRLNRGLSLIDGKGYYSRVKKEFIVIIVRKSESHIVLQTIKKVDPDAFVSIGNVMAVYGHGFDSYRPPIGKGKEE
ncbi:MAG: YitT family protein [Chlorobi bacterium]|nr:YitT family protein [Chlorobiota bacterium]